MKYISEIRKEEDQYWRNKWQQKLDMPAKRRFFNKSGVKSLRQFTYEQTYRVLEYFLLADSKTKSSNVSNELLQRILEVGCGSGTTSINIMKKMPGVKMYMVDRSFDAILVAKRNLSEENLEAFFIVADAFELPFKDRAFSTVFSIGLLEHFTDPVPIVIEKSRVLNTHGIWMALVVPMKFSMNHFIKPLYLFFVKMYHREKKLYRSFREALTLSCGPPKPTPFRNVFLDNFYKKVLNKNGNMDDIKCVYLDPFVIFVKQVKIAKALLFIYRGILFFKEYVFSQKIPFATNKYIARSFFITARRKI